MQTQTASNVADLFAVSPNKMVSTNKKNSDDRGEFLSLVLDAATNKAKKGEELTQDDVNQIIKEINQRVEIATKIQDEANVKITTDLEQNLDEAIKNELYENANFMQLLQVLEILNGGEKLSKFPNFSDKVASFLAVPKNVEELSNVKSVTDLLELSKRFDLGLEKLTITNDDVDILNNMFKNLGKSKFFTPILPKTNSIYSDNLIQKVEQAIILNQDNQNKKTTLNQLLQDITKETLKEQKNQPVTQTQVAQVVKDITKEITTPKIDVADESLETPDVINFTTKTDKYQSQKSVNLQSLLYPEREQNGENLEQNSEQSNQKKDSELNSMVRDISRAAQNQIQNRTAVRETLSNFSENLRDQIQNYKAPLTRVNITLNPMNLGEVEITMINRGNNLHINFNSTTNTMNLFLQNQAEFKANLVNMGFTELEMNFSDQQKQEREQKAYKKFAQNSQQQSESEDMEQPLLELVIPRYI
ncbi:flagellar hook-length control protein FliK [Campylobacter sp. faydin G-140]|uniref:flagellar hook-length control protein FliK n=1 Tax=Campylobacter anatolicus TaxID=2829105 RepID=UPI001B98819A|nr:flagellar hook-length control protein FliK [Campylobacter anatolicus]MBR8466231.1 flagellar hook-length control protein FliK [Campylobacter anatolicus]